MQESTVDVEMKLCGAGPWSIGTDFDLIHTPGHTEVRSATYISTIPTLELPSSQNINNPKSKNI